MKRFSDKEDRLYYIKSDKIEPSYTNCISTDHYLSDNYCKHIVTLDRDVNGEKVHVRTDQKFATYVVFRTWANEFPILAQGKGFSVAPYLTGK